ncbi:acyclic terpene utilization AtuA family protein [Allonocardiopsis opalescens]|uniref:Uncharacterized protein DUF1446 n=1 Tax=Allonocardiopsis opalescens TaxID=1144618 RepID=A0A2T0Q464_9ACTN|nr:acyclic terpene utilization AtuA family protein [Allonocardiopsis opalescens]PRX98598.1 uncharacterized protein DUF1446 [Allonocardiopsis opalescens]
MSAPLRIGNASGFYGDRLGAVREMLADGPLDVLTGDYLAELTMLILGRDRLADPGRGYAATFLRQMEDSLALAAERGVRIVSNAGGLNPAGLAAALRRLAERRGLPVRVAYVTGDELLHRAEALGFPGAVTANAYLGGWGIAEALRRGAEVVVTGRVTDASLVAGPAAAHFGWARDDFDALAGATAAGHVLECGTQATGGNYAFFTELLAAGHDLTSPGFPLAEVDADGSAVITKHPGTGGAVTVGTVTAQLLYEITGPRYAGPDVTARFDTVRLEAAGPDRVRLSGARGEPPPPAVKVGVNRLAGFRNEVTFVLTGLDIEAKAALVRAQAEAALGAARPRRLEWRLARTDRASARTEQEHSALLRVVAADPDAERVGRAFSSALVELALASYPGCHLTAPPGRGSPYGVFSAAHVDRAEVRQEVVLPGGERLAVPADGPVLALAEVPDEAAPAPPGEPGPVRPAPLGAVLGARSGDKGGDATLGVWARDDPGWAWLDRTLTADRLRELLPETAGLPVRRYRLPKLRALSFVLEGLLGEGVAATSRFDPQAKGVAEWLRAQTVDVPVELLEPG